MQLPILPPPVKITVLKDIDKKSSFVFFKKIVFKKVLKSFRRVLKSKNSLKS
jgi:hypothetical protein